MKIDLDPVQVTVLRMFGEKYGALKRALTELEEQFDRYLSDIILRAGGAPGGTWKLEATSLIGECDGKQSPDKRDEQESRS